jgi:RNA polymerase sigma factor (sigma-70 family)
MIHEQAGIVSGDIATLLGVPIRRELSDRQLLERFITERDQAAFGDLVRRYARGVWGVCRRLLWREQDAEDAFQAVFIILARKSSSIKKREAVGSWLHGVAYRTAMKARHLASHRTQIEKKASPPKAEDQPPTVAACRELQRQLDEELQGLAAKYRAPFVLCCLEGMSRAEAARELGWKEGTVSSRLAQARKLLQSRLARRGVALSAVLTAAALSQDLASAAAPAALTQAMAGTALTAPAGSMSPAATALAESVIKTMVVGKLKLVIVAITSLVMIGGTLLAAVHGIQDEPEARKPAGGAETFLPPPASIVRPIDERVFGVAFFPDGKKVVTAGAGDEKPGQLKVWDVDRREVLAQLSGFIGARAVAVSPTGKLLATGHFRGAIVLRDPDTGKELLSAQHNTMGVNALAFSKDGDLLASAGLDRTVKIFAVDGLKEQKVLRGHTDMVFSVAYFGHGKAVVSGGNDKTAIIWDLTNGNPRHLFKGHAGPIETVAVSPDDRLVATASWDRTIKLWDADTGSLQGTLTGSKNNVFAVAFSPDGELLASGCADGTVQLWDVKKLATLAVLGKHVGPVWAVAFTRNGEMLVSGSSDKTAKLWNVPKRSEMAALNCSEIRPIQAMAYAPDGKTLALAGDDRTVRLLDPKTGELRLALNGHQERVTCLAYSPDGAMLATGSTDKTVRCWNGKTGEPMRTLKGHRGAVLALAFSGDGKKIASAGDDQAIKLWDAASGDPAGEFSGQAATVRGLTFTADGQSVAAGSDDGMIRVCYLDRKVTPITWKGHQGFIRALAFSGLNLASASEDGTVKVWTSAPGPVWTPALGKEPRVLDGHKGGALSLQFTPSGNTLISGCRDGSVMVWDRAQGRPRGVLAGHRAAVTGLAVHPRGEHLISGGAGGGLLRWRAGTGQPVITELGSEQRRAARQFARQANPDAPSVEEDDDTPAGRPYLTAAIAVGTLIILLFGVVALVKATKRRAAKTEPGNPPTHISFTCSGCKRKLKAQPEWADKQVKCKCGASLRVPAATS